MIDLYLIRHAECTNNLLSAHTIGGRSSDSLLTPDGVDQARRLGQFLSDREIMFDEVHSSTAVRASDTAQLAGIPIEKIILSEQLEELSQGDWEGKARKDCYTPMIMEEIFANQLDFAPPHGESKRQVGDRVARYIEERILSNSNPRRVAVFTHGFCIRSFLHRIMQFKPELIYHMAVDNASMTELIYQNKIWKVQYINRIV